MKKIIILNGIHGSGKSTLGKNLENQGYAYFPEIGRELRAEVNYTLLDSVTQFDQEVMEREVRRDSEVLSAKGTPVVETWHTGNIAYAIIRSPQIAKTYKAQFKKSLEHFDPLMILLQIDRETFGARASEATGDKGIEDLWNFYNTIEENTLRTYEELNLKYICVDGAKTIPELTAEINASLRDRGYLIEIQRRSKEG